MVLKIAFVICTTTTYNNNNNLYSCPEITQYRLTREKKKYKRKEHSHLEIAKLIEISSWATWNEIC